ncbi:MAG: YbjN domain-containing protein [Chloroflexota bacterium]
MKPTSGAVGAFRPARRWRTLADDAPPLDAWLAELGIEVVGGGGAPGDAALSRDLLLDGARRFDLRTTVAWVEGVGLSAWAYYGTEEMEVPKRVYARMLRANYDYPFIKFALTDDDRPMLMTELPAAGLDRDAVARTLVRFTVVADRLLDETAGAVADRGQLPDWSGRTPRNQALLAAHRDEVEEAMPAWEPMPVRPRRRSLLERMLGTNR